jgi:signal peptidase II
MRKIGGIFLLVFSFVFLLDFLSKRYILGHLDQCFPIGFLLWDSHIGVKLYLQYVENRGGAWGMLSDYYPYLLGFRLLVISGLILYTFLSKLHWSRVLFLSFLLAGAMCNVIDCFLYGYVIDMIHFTFFGHSYGIFNIADASIFLGVFGLLFSKQKGNFRCTAQDL